MSGGLWVGAPLVSDPQMIHYPMPNVITLATVYSLVGRVVIAWFRDKFVAALLGLWALAVVFFAVLLHEPQDDWTLVLAGSYFGTIAFLMWCSVAFLILKAWTFHRSHSGRA
jgi:hypothetical protein